MTASPPPTGPALVGQNQYGKAECRVVRVTRDGPSANQHRVKDLSVSIALSGDLDEVHYRGDNAAVLPTDSMKNTVYAFAQEVGIDSAEVFGIRLARHFVTSQPPIHRARVRIEEYAWERITAGQDGPQHSFVRAGGEVRLAQVSFAGTRCEVICGLKDLVVMNTTDSEFWGFARDRYTTLPETRDRVLATEVSARWRHNAETAQYTGQDWDRSYQRTRDHLLAAFADTHSLSLQQTLYQMGARVINGQAEVDEVRLSLPNKHHFLVDLEPFGLPNPGEVYLAADRPYGLIEATVLREGVQPKIPVDLANL